MIEIKGQTTQRDIRQFRDENCLNSLYTQALFLQRKTLNEWYLRVDIFKSINYIYIWSVKNMLTEEYDLKMMSNRVNEKDLSSYVDVVLENFESYQQNLISLLEMCDESRTIKRQTKYLFKKVFETFTLENPNAEFRMMQFAAVNCLRHAIKFNETFATTSDLDIENWKKMVHPDFTTEDFLQIEALLYGSEVYSINFTTPYDYYGTFSKVFPMSEKHREGTMRMMNLCFTIPELMLCNAEHIFFGCLLAARTIDDIPSQWILNQTHFPQDAMHVSQIVYDVYTTYKNMQK